MRRTTAKDTRLVAIGLLAVIVSAVALIGCGSSSQAFGSSTAGSSSASASSGSSEGASAPRESKPIDVCAILPAATAAKLSGTAITKATPQSLQPKEYDCAYANDDDSLEIEVQVFEHDAVSTYDLVASASKNAQTVSGLGDKAFFDNDGTMYVLAGRHLIQVNGLKTADQCAALARPVVAALL
jgi:major membrane immunogen (membrane-anchored lipoprotein)